MSQKRRRAATSAPRKPGRPAGSRTRDYDAGQAMPSSCAKCKSTASHVLRKMTTLKQAGQHNGQPYNLVDLHRVQCDTCNQCRIDRTYRNEPAAA